MILFIKLLLAHLLGDFLLQPAKWVQHKERKKHKSYLLYMHGIIHGLLACLFVAEPDFYGFGIALIMIHILVDLAKLLLQNEKTRRIWFITDQLLHLASLAIITILYLGVHLSRYEMVEQMWLYIAFAFFLTRPASFLIKNIIPVFPQEGPAEKGDLANAGMYIGMLERLFVFGFILLEQFSAIGFLLAAKSVFRFGDLTQTKDRRLTEYVLIGTLISFGIAILTGVAANYLSAFL